jgi:hypothetical protein
LAYAAKKAGDFGVREAVYTSPGVSGLAEISITTRLGAGNAEANIVVTVSRVVVVTVN